ncbi:MAG: hypothetical protein A3J46_05570 [Candidatus Yanofskybacteria bacterium RIFCSPHIGHO2_02_FULL_41_11]|uniref:Uncharacterized protein n=1 Tax=Candidatus Yanofskybacteria bacterium RIFCSPHIGHO2_02_FULL_41_11 TaxID=1802675 RepID=A0A1F8FEG4_9BACT|nr:MAG: hypothetical protein A3J46_05570 [Candidatus Yanofskybacteria bacterium RIFCSPHIGHO2_02_FULL_41_11]
MSVETQALVPANSSVADFLAEIGRVIRECESSKPSRLSFMALKKWRQDKSRQIAEVTNRYAGNSQNALVPSGNGDISSVDIEALEEADGHIIKATCAAEKAREKMVRIENFRVFKIKSGESYFLISFIVKDSQGMIKISPTYKIEYQSISVFVNVSADRPVFVVLRPQSNNKYWHQIEFHVHSENDMKFLL